MIVNVSARNYKPTIGGVDLKLVATLYSRDELTTPTLPGFSCVVGKFF